MFFFGNFSFGYFWPADGKRRSLKLMIAQVDPSNE